MLMLCFMLIHHSMCAVLLLMLWPWLCLLAGGLLYISRSFCFLVSLFCPFARSFVHFIQIALIVDDVSRAWNHLFLFWWNETFNWNRFPTKYSATDHFAGKHFITPSPPHFYMFSVVVFFFREIKWFFYLHGFHLSIIRDVQFIHSFPFMQQTGESLFIIIHFLPPIFNEKFNGQWGGERLARSAKKWREKTNKFIQLMFL